MQEHPFAPYIRILGKGKKGSRSLTETEAHDAMGMILRDEVTAEQLGAFLMLLRIKEETAEEIAGFVKASRETIKPDTTSPTIDLDWSSYAGKRRQLPWFILSVLVLSDKGIRVFMHGASGHTAGRIYTRDVLSALGLPVSQTIEQAGGHISQFNFSFMDLEHLCPRLHHIIGLRPILGLRSPVHTLSPMLNPFDAPYSMESIFHPGYQAIHQGASVLLKQPHMAVIKGEGGEIERNPDLDCKAFTTHDGITNEEHWPAMFSKRSVKPDHLNLQDIVALWRGKLDNDYASAAVTGTLAITLKMMGRAETQADAQVMAEDLWAGRSPDLL
jgi:anthranilate phosphoribosyltransferase